MKLIWIRSQAYGRNKAITLSFVVLNKGAKRIVDLLIIGGFLESLTIDQIISKPAEKERNVIQIQRLSELSHNGCKALFIGFISTFVAIGLPLMPQNSRNRRGACGKSSTVDSIIK